MSGIVFRNVLIIDNDLNDVSELARNLCDRGMSVSVSSRSADAEAVLLARPEVNLIILDWYLDEEDSMEARALLGKLQTLTFAPVIIYTHQAKEDPQAHIESEKMSKIALVLEKDEVGEERVFDRIKEWLATNPELRIFLRWAYEVEKQLNVSLWQLFDLDAVDLRQLADSSSPNPTEAARLPLEYDLIEMFGRVLSRGLGKGETFMKSVREEVEALPTDESALSSTGQSLNRMMKLHNFERYGPAIVNPYWTGDVLRDGAGGYFILITPRCDLFSPGKVDSLLLLEAVPLGVFRKANNLHGNNRSSTDQTTAILVNKNASTHYLPFLLESYEGLVCAFDRITSIPRNEFRVKVENGNLVRIANIDSPYIENLLQRMNSYLNRLGVKDIHPKEVQRILEISKPS